VRKRLKALGVLLAAVAPAAYLTAQPVSAAAAATMSGSLQFLNYNVAGLPVVHEPPAGRRPR
jgi:hypothetical protein